MKLTVNFRNIKGDPETIEHIDRRLSFGFSRIRHKVESLEITIADTNGPKGGVDKQCQIVIKPVRLKRLIVTERRANLNEALDRCIERAIQSLNRRLRRKRHLALRLPREPQIETVIAHA